MTRLDRHELENLYRDHGHLVLRRARQILGNDADALEVLQEVFTSLLARPDQYAGASAPATFLYAMTTHRCFNRLRDDRTRARLLAEQVAPAAAASGAGDAEAHALLRQLLERLTLEEARAAFHHYIDGMTRPEVAEALGCSLRKVGKLLERAGDRLRAEAGDAPAEAAS